MRSYLTAIGNFVFRGLAFAVLCVWLVACQPSENLLHGLALEAERANPRSYDVYCAGKLVAEDSFCQEYGALLRFRGGFGNDCYCLERERSAKP